MHELKNDIIFVFRMNILSLKYAAIVLALVLLFSCSSTKKIPSSGAPPQSLPELPASEIDIPVKIAGASILAKA